MVQTQEHTGNILQNYIPETYVILLTNATPINSIKIKRKKRCQYGSWKHLAGFQRKGK